MSPWVRPHWTNVERRYHTDRDCYALARADGEPREASESEVEAYDLCKWCEVNVALTKSKTFIHHKLLEMDPDEVPAGGES